MTQALKRPKRASILITFFLTTTVVGFVPWETILSIQIRNNILSYLTDSSSGLFGLIGLLATMWIFIKDISRFALFIKLLSGCLAAFLAFLWILNSILPTFHWYDTAIYRNGNDYIVVQEQETFVTSNQTRPRVIRTKSPYSMIRKVEEEYVIKDNDDRFGGEEVIYNGKRWFKEPANNNH